MRWVILILAWLLLAPSIVWAACKPQISDAPGPQKALRLLDYLAKKDSTGTLEAADCAREIYDNVSLSEFYDAYPQRMEKYVSDVAFIQGRAAEKIGTANADAWRTYVKYEIELRKKIILDIEGLTSNNSNFRRIRMVQTTYLIQAMERVGDVKGILDTLIHGDEKIYQPNVVGTWLKALAACPNRDIIEAANASDAQLIAVFCKDCVPRAKSSLAGLSAWELERRISSIDRGARELYTRLKGASTSCAAS